MNSLDSPAYSVADEGDMDTELLEEDSVSQPAMQRNNVAIVEQTTNAAMVRVFITVGL